jgi:S1-C subfamily serine protease
LPAEKAGLKIGDRILACNGLSLAAAPTDRDAKRLCHVEAGETLQLEVRRANSPMELSVTAEKRPGL